MKTKTISKKTGTVVALPRYELIFDGEGADLCRKLLELSLKGTAYMLFGPYSGYKKGDNVSIYNGTGRLNFLRTGTLAFDSKKNLNFDVMDLCHLADGRDGACKVFTRYTYGGKEYILKFDYISYGPENYTREDEYHVEAQKIIKRYTRDMGDVTITSEQTGRTYGQYYPVVEMDLTNDSIMMLADIFTEEFAARKLELHYREVEDFNFDKFEAAIAKGLDPYGKEWNKLKIPSAWDSDCYQLLQTRNNGNSIWNRKAYHYHDMSVSSRIEHASYWFRTMRSTILTDVMAVHKVDKLNYDFLIKHKSQIPCDETEIGLYYMTRPENFKNDAARETGAKVKLVVDTLLYAFKKLR